MEITQPEGPSFAVDGYEVRWQKWRFPVASPPARAWSFTWSLRRPRNAPAGHLPSVARGNVRPLRRPDPTQYRKNVFDMGEYGMGLLANSLELGCDCLGEIYYFDACLNDNDGHPS